MRTFVIYFGHGRTEITAQDWTMAAAKAEALAAKAETSVRQIIEKVPS